jgi:hypothetical protein
MKKPVLMETINKVFADLKVVDYIEVISVTDDIVDLRVHLNKLTAPSDGTEEFKAFKERCLVLEKMLDRKVTFTLQPSQVTNYMCTRLLSYIDQFR